MENYSKYKELELRPSSMLLTGTGTQAVDKLRGCFMMEVVESAVISSLRAGNMKNDIEFDNVTMLAGQRIYAEIHTLKLTSGKVILYFDEDNRY